MEICHRACTVRRFPRRSHGSEVARRADWGAARRLGLASRLERAYAGALATGCLARFIVFGSFVTTKPEPNDVDIFMLMDDAFDVGRLDARVGLLFNHTTAQDLLGVSAFWLRRSTAFDGEQAAVEYWQIKRDGSRRGIVELVAEGL
jgi:uncharacterized protein DUF6932